MSFLDPHDYMQPVNCELFDGYKPCEPYKVCSGCRDRKPIEFTVLVVNLDAIGNVVQNTSLLPAIQRKYPRAHIDWLTRKSAAPVLETNPYLYRLWIFDWETTLTLQQMRYNVVLSCDKSRPAAALVESMAANRKLGFGLSEKGAIRPLNPEASFLYRMGLDDHLKFRINQRSGQDLLAEALTLPYRRDEYILELTAAEKEEVAALRAAHGVRPDEVLVGFNTGCAPTFPMKKMTVEQHVAMISRLQERDGVRCALLGGPSETERNAEIAARAGGNLINTPTTEGLRSGLVSIDACDVVATGCTSAMHMAIGLKKHVVAWFGPSCATEVDLYDRGMKIVQDVPCSPCWKKTCENVICRDTLDIADYAEKVLVCVDRIRSGGTSETVAAVS